MPRIWFFVDEALCFATIRTSWSRISRSSGTSLETKSPDEEIARIIIGYEKPAIIFCSSVEHAENFANYLPSAVTFHSGKSNQDNDNALRDFRDGNVRYILAVDKFNEGIDVPEVELIVFLRSTGSRTVFLQQLGRGLRRVSGKEKVTVLDFVANCDRVIMVQQMVREVARIARSKFDLDKGQIHLEGHGFSFDFDENVKDILEIIRMVMTKLFIADIPHLLAEYDAEKNPLPEEEVRAGTNVKLWWKCSKPECGHEWQASGNHRVGGTGCPACARQVVTPKNCMKATHPDLAKEFHPTKNDPDTTESVVASTQKKVWWKCSKPECGHEWQAIGSHRVGGTGCPSCVGTIATPTNCMKATHPDLAKEFHPTKNDPDTTESVVAGTAKRVWWKCQKCQHEWQSAGYNRVKGKGCPACANSQRWVTRRLNKSNQKNTMENP
ncbi:MAG: zinc-ribbon domain-containing protein [Candidatus Magasanikbacteria bacterium]